MKLLKLHRHEFARPCVEEIFVIVSQVTAFGPTRVGQIPYVYEWLPDGVRSRPSSNVDGALEALPQDGTDIHLVGGEVIEVWEPHEVVMRLLLESGA